MYRTRREVKVLTIATVLLSLTIMMPLCAQVVGNAKPAGAALVNCPGEWPGKGEWKEDMFTFTGHAYGGTSSQAQQGVINQMVSEAAKQTKYVKCKKYKGKKCNKIVNVNWDSNKCGYTYYPGGGNQAWKYECTKSSVDVKIYCNPPVIPDTVDSLGNRGPDGSDFGNAIRSKVVESNCCTRNSYKPDAESRIIIDPIATHGIITFNGTFIEQGTGEIELYNVFGTKVKSLSVVVPRGKHDSQYSSNLPSGVYFVHVTINGQNVERAKILIIQ
jgi:hypothetical protein